MGTQKDVPLGTFVVDLWEPSKDRFQVSVLLILEALTGLAAGALSVEAKIALRGLGTFHLGHFSIPNWFLDNIEVDFVGELFIPVAAVLVISAMIVGVTKGSPGGVLVDSPLKDCGIPHPIFSHRGVLHFSRRTGVYRKNGEATGNSRVRIV